MITFPNAKINIGLNIVGKREDGYHNLETLFYPIPLCDALEIIPSNDATSFVQHGFELDCPAESNLVNKAYNLLTKSYNLPPLTISLFKKIPSGAGLGGGSSDAAFMLCMLNDQFNLGIPTNKLEQLANTLGADCPFFIQNKPQFATGTGNIFASVECSLKGKTIVIVKPDLHISTKEAFARIKPHRPTKSILSIIQQELSTWKEELVNDFEQSIFPNYPILETLKSELYQQGALYAAMSGSGSALYGLFDNEIILPNHWEKLFTFQGKL